jgi:hypothetical protein
LDLHRGQVVVVGADVLSHWALRWRVRDRLILRFGTAMGVSWKIVGLMVEDLGRS